VAGAINAFCGPAVRRFLDAECGADGCRTGDALRSPTFGLLPSAHIVHTIAPRYTAQYHDAAVYALHRCGVWGMGGCGWVGVGACVSHIVVFFGLLLIDVLTSIEFDCQSSRRN
jgi:hypothetical protein